MIELKEYLTNNYFVEGDRLKSTSTRRFVNEDTILTALLNTNDDVTRRVAREAVSDMISDHQETIHSKVSGFIVYDTPQEFIDFVFKLNNFECDDTGDEFIIKNEDGDDLSTDRATVETTIVKEMYEYNNSVPKGEDNQPMARKYIKDELLIQLDYYIRKSKIQNVLEMREALKHDPKVKIDVLLEKTLKMMMADGDMKVNVTVFKHWLWCLKRHIYGREVKLELWLALFGGQNIGKNYFVDNVLGVPLKGHIVDTELNAIADIGREIGKFQNRFLINFDELAKGGGQSDDSGDTLGPAAMAQLKAVLTRKKLTVRQLGSQNQMVIKKSFACMSTANVHIYDVIDDPTGMRRFFEIKLNHPDNTWFNRKDITTLMKYCEHFYTGINEDLEEGYLLPGTPEFEAVKEIQASYKSRSSIDYWMDEGEYDITDEKREDDEFVSLTDLHSSYKAYCKEAGNHPFNRTNFTKSLDRRVEIKNHANIKGLRAILRDT